MEIIQWSDKYSVKISEIDNQHKGLVIIINTLFTQISEGKARENLHQVFDHLTDYINIHFRAEEKMLEKYNYPNTSEHKSQHAIFVNKLEKLKLDFKNGKVTISLEVLNFLKDWLINHILHNDQEYSEYILKASKDNY